MGAGAKVKGYLKNCETNEIRKFMFNPNSVEYDITKEYNSMVSPGLSYPKIEYGKGSVITRPYSLYLRGEDTEDYISYLEGLVTPKTKYSEPPMVICVFGTSVCKGYINTLKVNKTLFDNNLKCTEATCDINIVEVRDI